MSFPEKIQDMSQSARLLLFLVIFIGPWAATIYVTDFRLQESGLDILFQVGALILASLLVSAGGSLMLARVVVPSRTSRLIAIGRANLVLALADIGIFALLVYGRRYSPSACDLGLKCLSYPAIWLALAGMHLCYALTSYMIKFKTRSEGV